MWHWLELSLAENLHSIAIPKAAGKATFTHIAQTAVRIKRSHNVKAKNDISTNFINNLFP
jgi:hypothetical protein